MAIVIPPAPVGTPFGDYSWIDWYQKIRRAINDVNLINHNDLQNIQGGTTDEFYHMTSAQHTALATAENTNNKDDPSGYAGLNASSRITKGVDTTDDVIIDLATKGLVLKDTQATPHYWRVTISTTGVLTTTDLGTSKP